MVISSLDNSKVKEVVKLQNKKYRDETNLFVVETCHLVEEAKKAGLIKELFLFEKEFVDSDNINYVTSDVMKKMSSLESPSNVLAICNKKEEKEINGNVLILDGVQDPGNLGTIIRSAIAFNIDTVILSNDSVDLYNSKVLRATEGMIFNINIIRRDLNEILPELKNKYTIYTTNVVNGTRLEDIKVNKPFALIMGSEGNGVKDSIASYADESVYINMNDKCESLNVGVATSIILYEFNK
jgi:TrmH family RNA methyltransferase